MKLLEEQKYQIRKLVGEDVAKKVVEVVEINNDVPVSQKSIKDIFEFGFEEIELNQMTTGVSHVYHLKDFTDGDMKKYYHYPLWKLLDEFNSLVSIR